jgi:hypothetical protein
MTCVISNDNRVQVLREGVPQPENAALVFSSSEELLAGTSEWTLGRLVLVWNKLPGCKRVTRFENRRIALDRLWRAIQKIRQRARAPRSESAVARGNKTQLVISVLREPDGATLDKLMTATKWQAHSVARCRGTSACSCNHFTETATASTPSRSERQARVNHRRQPDFLSAHSPGRPAVTYDAAFRYCFCVSYRFFGRENACC